MWKQDAKHINIKDINERREKGINARAEWLNDVIQELKTIGRGYENIGNSGIAVLFFTVIEIK
jgi:hypothetical protein